MISKVKRFPSKLSLYKSLERSPHWYTHTVDSGSKVRMSEWKQFRPLIYEREMVQRLEQVLGEDDVFVDVGANKGFYSLYAAALGCEKVYSFEIDTAFTSMFNYNEEINDYSNIELVEKAVADEEGVVTIENSHESTNSIVEGGGLTVPSVTLDGFFEGKNQPDVVKIDVEGAELDVVEGALNVIEEGADFLVETHDRSNTVMVASKFMSLGYSYDYLRSDRHGSLLHFYRDESETSDVRDLNDFLELFWRQV